MDEDCSPLHLFEGYGIELEYMIVKQDTLDILPISDKILSIDSGDYSPETFPLNQISWSNELVLHLLEFKTNGPASTLEALPEYFRLNIQHANEKLASYQAKLMPTAMHPWMNPLLETHLWPHSYSEVYSTYNQIFNCQGHGWSNLQSMHINLPFGNEEEFGRLHAAIRLVLPILPALAASSPIVESRITGIMDTRMEIYRHNQERVPEIIGKIIPEAIFTYADYHHQILEKSYAAIAPYDPDENLREEWLNSRGAITRFSRNAIEIRVIDVQECPLCDIAVAAAAVAIIKGFIEERWTSWQAQKQISTDFLSALFLQSIKTADATLMPGEYLACFGRKSSDVHTARELWKSLLHEVCPQPGIWQQPWEIMLTQGTLSQRILCAVKNDTTRSHLTKIYEQLSQCLANNRPFLAP